MLWLRKAIDAIVKSDYLMQEMEKKMGQTGLLLPFLRHNADTN